jgi:hypothetical protein
MKETKHKGTNNRKGGKKQLINRINVHSEDNQDGESRKQRKKEERKELQTQT